MDFTLTVTPAALAKIKSLLTDKSPPIRLALQSGGCAGFSQKIEFGATPQSSDYSITIDGIQFLVDPKSQKLLGRLTLEWQDDLLAKQFYFNTDSRKTSCGCGTSFSL